MKENKITRECAIYCRVSTDEQNIENQVEELKNYSSQYNYRVKGIYTDEISGTKESRPALNTMMFDARKGMFDIVIMWKLDRLGRSLQHLIRIVNEFKDMNIDFVCVTQPFLNTTTPEGKLIFAVIGAMAEFECDLISERTKLGLRRAKAEGKPIGKRGKDKKKRRTSGYHLRYQKKGGAEYVRF